MKILSRQGWTFRIAGSGSEVVLVFYGFGQNWTAFRSWMPQSDDEFTLVIAEPPEQSSTTQLTDPKSWFPELINELNIKQCTLAGFSMGCRFALHLAFLFPDQITRLWLMAPDSLPEHPIYRLAVRTPIRRLFRYAVNHPGGVLGLLRLLQFLRISRLAKTTWQNESARRLLYYSWTNFAAYGHSTQFKTLAERKSVSISVTLADQDEWLPARNTASFLQSYPSVALHQLTATHRNLIKRSAPLLLAQVAKK